MYEHKSKPLISKAAFARRLIGHGLLAFAIIGFSLLIGILAYHHLARLSWVDALLNASMILGGMGPVDTLPTDAAKIFASFYALYSGCVLLVSVGLLFAPIVHRIFHKLHLQAEGE